MLSCQLPGQRVADNFTCTYASRQRVADNFTCTCASRAFRQAPPTRHFSRVGRAACVTCSYPCVCMYSRLHMSPCTLQRAGRAACVSPRSMTVTYSVCIPGSVTCAGTKGYPCPSIVRLNGRNDSRTPSGRASSSRGRAKLHALVSCTILDKGHSQFSLRVFNVPRPPDHTCIEPSVLSCVIEKK